MSVGIEPDEPEKSLPRNPFVVGTIVVVVLLIAYSFYESKRNVNPDKLDYSEPIYTAEDAIICPQTLLIDPRAEGDSSQMIDAFNSNTSAQRTAKAHDLGCEDLRAGVPVFAHPMAAPYQDYVAVSYHYGEISTLFTKEADLNNHAPDHPPYPDMPPPGSGPQAAPAKSPTPAASH